VEFVSGGEGSEAVGKTALYKVDEFIDAEPSLPNDGAQSSPIQFFVIGDNHLRKRIISTQDHVASLLMTKFNGGF
jgi:hypothetical protein